MTGLNAAVYIAEGLSINPSVRIVPVMRFAEDSNSSFSIQSIGEEGVVVGDKLIKRSVLISPDSIQEWPPASVAELEPGHLSQCESLEPEIVIIGTGHRQVSPPAQLAFALQKKGIGVEIMANDAACRTFNVLISEDRHVVLALMLK